MESLAYFYVAFADVPVDVAPWTMELPSSPSLSTPDWRKLSSRAWGYMLPLALTLSLLTVVNTAFALERGDQGPSVSKLQRQLKNAGFYQAQITKVFDLSTEEAVKRFQKSAGLEVNGVANNTTLDKLARWRSGSTIVSTKQSSQSAADNFNTVANKRRHPSMMKRGDEGEDVRTIQERLRVAGFYYGRSTGIFGPITEESVKRFQQAYNLPVDGIVGPRTVAKLPPVGVGYGDETPSVTKDKDKLRLGDRGEPVRLLQQQLIQAGYLTGEPNGYYGPHTADAIRRFQADNYLAASGVAGPTTRAKLHSAVASSQSDFDVLEIQRRLKERGFYKGPLNGLMAEDTRQAIRQAQQFYGISPKDLKSGTF
ncbi:peptidoglycan-binding domain-containing protein [Calothrix sp. 336/3]|uniref:peptidoglycan-binding domain-containing protein n=1 Tax=Calothrix sp. 336/3 TaxID=1337936 RepID=UPI0004E38949|nr:peptidoglycan-binding protein [Calothrix sp. 336/3]AKG23734.1 cell wall-binding protein [Calothrix sp. 336/3]